jgi:hypothetical protein
MEYNKKNNFYLQQKIMADNNLNQVPESSQGEGENQVDTQKATTG